MKAQVIDKKASKVANFESQNSKQILTYKKTLSLIQYKRRKRAISEKEKCEFYHQLINNRNRKSYKKIQDTIKEYETGRVYTHKFKILDFLKVTHVVEITFLTYSFYFIFYMYWFAVKKTGGLINGLRYWYNAISDYCFILFV